MHDTLYRPCHLGPCAESVTKVLPAAAWCGGAREGGWYDGMGVGDPLGICPRAWGLPPFGMRRRSSAPGV